MKLRGPTEAVGDGKTLIHVLIPLEDSSSAEIEGIVIELNAGRVGRKQILESGRIDVEVLPPRVAEPFLLTVDAKSRHGESRGSISIRLLPAIAATSMRSSSGEFELRVPQQLVLGHDATGEITFRQRLKSRATLHASAGVISQPERVGSELFRARYTPPSDKLPQVAVIAIASEDGSQLDWAPIRLVGRPLLKTVSEPGAAVLARVGDEEFGPFRADRRGRVEIRVLAQPGVATAQTLVRDALGNERSLKLGLGVAHARTTFAVCPPASEALYLFAVDALGEPRPDLDIRVHATLGSTEAPRFMQRGYYVSHHSVPPAATLGEAIDFVAEIAGEVGSRTSCSASVVGEAPVQIQLVASPARLIAGSHEPIRIQAKMTFSGARKPRMVPLQAVVDLGTLSEFVASSVDSYDALWTLPANFSGRSVANLTVRTLSPRSVKGGLVIPLRPGPPALLSITLDQSQLKADGRSETDLIARIFDAHGNAADAAVEVIDAMGSISRFVQKAPGVYAANYQSPQSATQTADEIVVGVQSTSIVGRVKAGLIPVSNRFRLLGGVGYASNLGRVSGPQATLWGSVRLPWLGERLSAGAQVSYLSSHDQGLDAAAEEVVQMDVTLVPIVAKVTYEFVLPKFRPYIGTGVGLGPTRLGYSSESAGAYRLWRTSPVYSVGAGMLVPFGPGLLWGDFAYRHIPLSEPSIRGNAGGLSAELGYGYEF